MYVIEVWEKTGKQWVRHNDESYRTRKAADRVIEKLGLRSARVVRKGKP